MSRHLHGFDDGYEGPVLPVAAARAAAHDDGDGADDHPSTFDDDYDPLRPGKWMDGDSLSPPLGSSIETIHALLDLASVCRDDVLYDLGCGDGRVCLEAWARCGGGAPVECVGVEVEKDLVERFRELIDRLPSGGVREEDDDGRDGDEEELTKGEGWLKNMASKGGNGRGKRRRRRIWVVHDDLRNVLRSLLCEHKDNGSGEVCEEENERFDMTTTSNCDGSGSGSGTDDDEGPLPTPSVITLYLLPDALNEIEPDIATLLRTVSGLRVVCNAWGFPKKGWLKPMKEMNAPDGTTLRLYTRDSLVDGAEVSGGSVREGAGGEKRKDAKNGT